MVVGLNEPPSQSAYQVWLTGEGEPVMVGQVSVDSTGWGATTIYPVESLFEFDRVQITNGPGGDSQSRPRNVGVVLEGGIHVLAPPE